MKTGKEKVEDCLDWIEGNKKQFNGLLHICRAQNANPKVNLLRRGDIFYLCTRAGMSITDVEGIKFSNNIWAPLSRYLIMCDPSLRRIIKPGRSVVDGVDMKAAWVERFGIDPFKVERWSDAKCA